MDGGDGRLEHLLSVALLWRAYMREALGVEEAEDYLAPARNQLEVLTRKAVERAERRLGELERSWPPPKGELPPAGAFRADHEETKRPAPRSEAP
jgi:hypothetical protein